MAPTVLYIVFPSLSRIFPACEGSSLPVRWSEKRIDERRHRRTLSEHYQPTEQQHHDYDRGEPEFPTAAHKSPEIFYKLSHQNGFSICSRGALRLGTR